ncbi:MAG: yrrB [Gammaproteobacteria bacterium]|jgi:predicted TPR repeat methyltransferase|nr:yrrB [Gammaproteobacteria bacterium]
MEKNSDIEKICALHQSGELEQAKIGYLTILRDHPTRVEALHGLGILCIQQDHFSDAVEYLKKAIKYDARNPIISLHLSNALKLQGLFSQAIQVLQNIIAHYPDYAPAFNNLGTVYYAQGKLDEAIHYYHKAITKHENYVDAYYNLGLALIKKDLFSEGTLIYKKLLQYEPKHFAARFHLACIFMKQNNIEEALAEFITIEIAQPYHFETQSNLATCYLKQGAFNQAKLHYKNALALQSKDTQILFNLGYIHMQQGFLDTAIQYYQRALAVDPDLFSAHNNLGVAFLAKQHASFAMHHFQEALRLQPDNKAVAYTISVLSKNQHLLAAPPDYIQSLFDAYADHYEPHLLTALDYQLPTLFEKVFSRYAPTNKPLDILDLGCGTGLCSAPFKRYAKTLTGIDLSANMLNIAAQKNLYDQLIHTDITHFLEDKIAQYDLILAGDALVYIGELDKLFQFIYQALRPAGLFMFNAEISESPLFKMNQSGRFSHHKTYLDKLVTTQHFSILSYEEKITRLQNNEPVYGHIYMLKNA